MPRDGLIFGFDLSGETPRPVEWEEVRHGLARAWLHLDRTHPHAKEWLMERSGLDDDVIEALLASNSRPRVHAWPKGVLVTLRGVNLNPGAEPEDMISLRIWMDAERLLTLRRERVMAADDVRRLVVSGEIEPRFGALVAEITERLSERAAPVVDELTDALEELEERIVEGDGSLREELADHRRSVISLRRHLAPQRVALDALTSLNTPLLTDEDRRHLGESANRVTRMVEELDAARDRAVVVHEELAAQKSDLLNRRMYLLTIMTAIFLPLSFVTGLLGINVGGIPGSDEPAAFLVVCGILLGAGVVLGLALRALRWF